MTPTRQHPDALKEELIQASLDILGESGARLDVREACRRVNRSQTAAYTVFGKEKDGGGFTALLAAVATRGFEDLGTRLGSAWAAAGDDLTAGLADMSHAYLDFAREKRGLYRLMFGEKLMTWQDAQQEGPPREEFSDLVRARLHVQQILTAGIAAARQAGVVSGRTDLEHALHAWATLHGLVELVLAGQFELLFDTQEAQRFIDDSVNHLIGSMKERR